MPNQLCNTSLPRFGSADAAIGQNIELSLDVFGFSESVRQLD
jgi:hypothetical protein